MHAKAFPRALAVDPEGCGCTECIIGEYVPLDNFLVYAQTGDVLAVVEGKLANNTYLSTPDLIDHLIKHSFNPDVQGLKGSDELKSVARTHFSAVDPEGCGCTECIIGEYVRLDEFIGSASVKDLRALSNGEIQNNTYDPLGELLIRVIRESPDPEVNALISDLRLSE